MAASTSPTSISASPTSDARRWAAIRSPPGAGGPDGQADSVAPVVRLSANQSRVRIHASVAAAST